MTLVLSVYPSPHEPTPAQAIAGNYIKGTVKWRGLEVAIENKAGTIRRGTNRNGVTWERRIPFDYGYVRGTTGMDGDQVDCYVGPDMDAPMVFVIHQRKYGKWAEYDEDKCMIGFDCEESARAAFLAAYDDPRFLGDVTAMNADDFVEKVRATKDKPAVIKALVFMGKSFVGSYVRNGRAVRGYTNSRQMHPVVIMRQPDLFDLKQGDATPANCDDGALMTGPGKGFYVTLVRGKKTAWLAGPFKTDEAAKANVAAARDAAAKIDPFVDFDFYGTASIESDKPLRPGVLNATLGLGS